MTEGRSALAHALSKVVKGHELEAAEMRSAMDQILTGAAPDELLGAFAVALRMRGESVGEIAAAAEVMRTHSRVVEFDGDGPLLDTCGTGGDGSGSFNVSTTVALVVAAAGVRVAKHGNRAVSSRCGSADLLEALGICLELSEDGLRETMREVNIAFLFAPAHHAALRHAARVRRSLGLRTFFNLLGPLANPAAASHQLVGVYEEGRVSPLGHVLKKLGGTGAWVVHGSGGLDEISPMGPTQVARFSNGGEVERVVVRPEDFGLAMAGAESLSGGDKEENAQITRSIVCGDAVPQRTPVLLNAAAALLVAGVESDPKRATERAAEAIDAGDVQRTLERWVELSRDLRAD